MKRGDIIQIAPSHAWAFCLAVVDEVKSFGCQAFVRIPSNDGTGTGDAFVRLNSADYEEIGASVIWGPPG